MFVDGVWRGIFVCVCLCPCLCLRLLSVCGCLDDAQLCLFPCLYPCLTAVSLTTGRMLTMDARVPRSAYSTMELPPEDEAPPAPEPKVRPNPHFL